MTVDSRPVISGGRAQGSGHRPAKGRSVWTFLSKSGRRQKASSTDTFWQRQALLWITFSFAAGIAIYALLPAEPSWPLLSGVLAGAGLYWLREQHRLGVSRWVLLALGFWAGLTCAALRTAYIDAPRLAEEMTVDLTGYVVERQESVRGTRLVLSVDTVEGRSTSDTTFPALARIRVPSQSTASVGNLVQLRARLFPPAGPVLPGGYDFSFRAFFSQIGATGFSFGTPTVLPQSEVPLRLFADAAVQSVRNRFGKSLKRHLPDGQETALVMALLVGDRSGIDGAHEENLRAAGLAHILAISGLHMALFAGGAYAAALFLLALVPGLSLRWPIHKAAALVALLAAVFYLMVSGASVATQRSFLMITLVFLGILAGRRGVTLRSVAIAGLVLLVLAPERLFFPGFQMSFAAVICLVAVYETWRDRYDPFGKHDSIVSSLRRRFVSSFTGWMLGLLVTALVAGLATGIIAAHHFGRVAPFGVLGNLLGMPVFTLLVMPMGVLGVILMPFGLAGLPLSVMSLGLTLILQIASFVAGLDGGTGAVGRLTGTETLAFSAALFAGLLLRGRWRLSALAPLVIGIVMTQFSPPADVQIAASGARLAARDADGLLKWSANRQAFLTDAWYQSEGLEAREIKSRKMVSPQRLCDRQGCVIRAFASRSGRHAPGNASKPLLIALPRTQEALIMDCQYADLIVSDLIVPDGCAAKLVIDRDVRRKGGAVSLLLFEDVRPGTGPPADQTTRNDGSLGSAGTEIASVRYAIAAAPRPWHKPGEVTRASLR